MRPASKAARASSSSGGRSREPTCSAGNGGRAEAVAMGFLLEDGAGPRARGRRGPPGAFGPAPDTSFEWWHASIPAGRSDRSDGRSRVNGDVGSAREGEEIRRGGGSR